MDEIDAQDDLNARFKYKSDTGDKWTYPGRKGKIRDDCEGYATELSYIASGSGFRFWLNNLTGKHVLWYGKLNGVGHVMLKTKRGWTDNNLKRFVSDQPKQFKKRLPIWGPLLLLFFVFK